MTTIERFLEYVTYDTQSDPTSSSSPSTAKQKKLAERLVSDLQEMGCEQVHMDEYGYVYARIRGNVADAPRVGLIAHMDTAPDYSGADVHPRIISAYDGGDIRLNDTDVTYAADFPELSRYIGKTLVVTDGHSLLGADDKAGVAEILSLAEYWLQHPEEPHGDIAIAFTPDEEVGRGTEHFDVAGFDCDFAYTVDGGEIEVIAYENFNAAAAVIDIQGVSIHPGSAKNKMINALHVAMELDAMLPAHERPEHTEGYEGFYHLMQINGTADAVRMEYIIRNHDRASFEQQKSYLQSCAEWINQRYGKQLLKASIRDSYYNMKECFEGHEEIIEYAKQAIEANGLTVRCEAIRGGTDGAMLTYQGLLCPNLGTGGGNFHGKHEYVCVEDMNTVVSILIELTKRVAKE